MSEEKQPEQTNEVEHIHQEEAPTEGATSTQNELEAQLNQYKDLLLRKAAEFENYKRRVEQESLTLMKFANEGLITDILPVVDDIERSLKAGREQKDFDTFYKGLELIHQKLLKILAARGVRVMESVGLEFNVDDHDAMLQVPREDVPPHTVLEEVEKGYLLHDKVIRHAKVIVSAAPEPAPVQEREPSNAASEQKHS
jgi:molecular chaperone GrpE